MARKKAEEMEASLTLEEEELGGGPADPARGAATASHSPFAPEASSMAVFAIGALVVLASVGLLVAGFAGDYYELDVRNGPQPDGDTDDSPRIVFHVGLRDHTQWVYPQGTGDPVRETLDWDESPIVAIAMKQLAWTSYIGLGLVGLAFLAAVLHRFGALTVAGPAPILALFGVTIMAVGLTLFVTDIAHHARVEWIPGRLDLAPAFWTSNADGDFVHDLYMNPLTGFWLHAAGVAAAAVGSLMLFWGQITGAGRSVKAFAESATVD